MASSWSMGSSALIVDVLMRRNRTWSIFACSKLSLDKQTCNKPVLLFKGTQMTIICHRTAKCLASAHRICHRRSKIIKLISPFALCICQFTADKRVFFCDAWFQAAAAVYMRSELFCDFTQRRMVVSYRRFGTTYRSHPLKMGPIGRPETSVRNYHSTLHKIPQKSVYLLIWCFLSFSQRCSWGFRCSGIWRWVKGNRIPTFRRNVISSSFNVRKALQK